MKYNDAFSIMANFTNLDFPSLRSRESFMFVNLVISIFFSALANCSLEHVSVYTSVTCTKVLKLVNLRLQITHVMNYNENSKAQRKH